MMAGPLTMHFAAGYVSRSDLVAALLIHDNIGKRPILFAVSAASFPEEALGLVGHMVTEGLVRKVMPDSVVVGGQIADSQYMGLVDMARTKALLFKTYHVDTVTRTRPGGWYDPPSADMLAMYMRTDGAFSQVLAAHGEMADAAESMHVAEAVQKAIAGP